MLSRVFSKSQSLVRGFSKVSTAHTKYNVLTIPCLKDNFSIFVNLFSYQGYIVSTTDNKNCVVVDPSNPAYVEDAVQNCGFNLKGILVTHHHMSNRPGASSVESMLSDWEKC